MRSKSLLIIPLCLLVPVAYAAIQWTMQPRQSELVFIATQAGAQFEGKFEKFTADIRFDPKDLTGSRFDVTIDMASVNTRDGERDQILKGEDLFAVKQYPTARYVADKFIDKGKGQYSAPGRLTLRDVTKEVPIEFTFTEDPSGAWLKGTATLKRLDFGVGQGDWKDTQTVANEVKVRFALLLNKG